MHSRVVAALVSGSAKCVADAMSMCSTMLHRRGERLRRQAVPEMYSAFTEAFIRRWTDAVRTGTAGDLCPADIFGPDAPEGTAALQVRKLFKHWLGGNHVLWVWLETCSRPAYSSLMCLRPARRCRCQWPEEHCVAYLMFACPVVHTPRSCMHRNQTLRRTDA